MFNSKDKRRGLFEDWLNSQQSVYSGKIKSYLRAIDILENEFGISIYSEADVTALQDLYDDLKLNQRDKNGKYYYGKAKSYGAGGFYSAAVGTYIDFVRENPVNSKKEYTSIS
jgi:5-methylcytosine-specific restriction enzyme B